MNYDLSTVPPSLCAGIAVTLAALVVIDFVSDTSSSYRERYVKEAAVELDDVLLNIPPDRIFVLSLAICCLAGFLAMALLGLGSSEWSWTKGLVLAVIAALLAFPAPRLYLRWRKRRRLLRFNEQLEDALTAMGSALKAGFSINQALDIIAQENRPPISFEFRLLVQEIRLGVSVDDALGKMVDRMQSDDLELVATAIITARQTGGELTVIFQRLSEMIRERLRIEGRLRALTAQGKLQASVIGAMPFLLMFMMSYAAPAMMDAFFSSMIGVALIVGASIIVIIGFFVIKKITTIDI